MDCISTQGGRLSPSLRDALAFAIVARRRRDAVLQELQARVTQLESEVETLRARHTAAALPTPAHLLSQLAASQQQAGAPVTEQPPGSQSPASWAQAEAQLACLGMWARAAGMQGAEGRQLLLWQLQRYLLQKDAAAAAVLPSDTGTVPADPAVHHSDAMVQQAAPTARLLERTPVTALLELLTDLLDTAGDAALPSDQAEQLLKSACTQLAALASLPGEAAGSDDFVALQEFAAGLLGLAGEQPPPAPSPAADQPGPSSLASAAPGGGADSEAAPSPSRRQLAQRMLSGMCGFGSTGLVVLGCAAVAAQATMSQLVEAVTGEPLASAAGHSQRGSPAGSPVEGIQPPPQLDEADEARLVHAFAQYATLLYQGLRALPGWMAEQGGCDDAFMQSVALAIMAASDACKLVALSLPATARQMQRVSTALVNALHHIAAAEQQQGPDF